MSLRDHDGQAGNASIVPELHQSKLLRRNCLERLCQELQGGSGDPSLRKCNCFSVVSHQSTAAR